MSQKMSALSGILSDTYHLVDIVYNIRDSTLCIISSQFLPGNKDIWQVCFRTLILNIVIQGIANYRSKRNDLCISCFGLLEYYLVLIPFHYCPV